MAETGHLKGETPRRRLPPWLKRPLPLAGRMEATSQILRGSGVATVCREAKCPNRTECWSHRTATFMILGDRCTRACAFCAVETGRPTEPSADEPERLAEAAAELGLLHVVITSVSRDDLPDEGAGMFAACVQAVRRRLPEATIEVLPPDFHARSECIAEVCGARPDVYNHNIETVARLTPAIRPQADYQRSLSVLRQVAEMRGDMVRKSGLMVGLGETVAEIQATLAELRAAGCQIVTIGQYLQPTPMHVPVDRFYEPEAFEELGRIAAGLGFEGVAAGPFVRSSYQAGDVYRKIRDADRSDTNG